jgi:hypothetical protein
MFGASAKNNATHQRAPRASPAQIRACATNAAPTTSSATACCAVFRSRSAAMMASSDARSPPPAPALPHEDGAVVIQLTGDPVVDADAIAGGLARCSAELFCLDERATWLCDGKLIGLNRDMLPELVGQYVFTKTLAIACTGRYEVAYSPVTLDERLIRAIIAGTDHHVRGGGPLKNGALESRLPKVASNSIGLAA